MEKRNRSTWEGNVRNGGERDTYTCGIRGRKEYRGCRGVAQ